MTGTQFWFVNEIDRYFDIRCYNLTVIIFRFCSLYWNQYSRLKVEIYTTVNVSINASSKPVEYLSVQLIVCNFTGYVIQVQTGAHTKCCWLLCIAHRGQEASSYQ